jgi:CheY-like chemotaxis protein
MTPDAPLKILIVDGDGASALSTRTLLEQAGYAARMVGNGPEVINILNSVYFDLVLMDVDADTAKDFRTARAIRQMDDVIAGIPIIALSGTSDPQASSRCLKAGMNGFLAKPFSLLDFSDALRRMHNRRIFGQAT